MKKLQLIKISLLAAGLVFGSAMAATQGNLGGTSTGTININVDIDPLVQVSNFDDFTFAAFAGGSSDLTASDDFCVYSNGGTYSIAMSGDAGAFTINSGSNILPYSVDFVNVGAPVAMTNGTPLAGQTNANTTSTNCDAGATDNVSVTVTIANSDLASQPSGTYTGILTILVAAE